MTDTSIATRPVNVAFAVSVLTAGPALSVGLAALLGASGAGQVLGASAWLVAAVLAWSPLPVGIPAILMDSWGERTASTRTLPMLKLVSVAGWAAAALAAWALIR